LQADVLVARHRDLTDRDLPTAPRHAVEVLRGVGRPSYRATIIP
jgi:hypothetical protein